MQVSPSVPRPAPDPVDGLESLPAGPVLAAALADIDADRLDGFDAVLVLKARARQANHARGELFASVADVLSRHDPHGPPAYTRDAYGVFEVAAALTMSRPAAQDLSRAGLGSFHPAAGGAGRAAGRRSWIRPRRRCSPPTP